MAYREMDILDIKEIIRRLNVGESAARVADALGMCRKTVRRYWNEARKLQLDRPAYIPSDEDLVLLLRAVRQTRAKQAAPSETVLLPLKDRIQKELQTDKIRLTKIHDRLVGEGTAISYAALHRFAVRHCDFGKSTITVRLADTRPGEAAYADWGHLGKLRDPATGKNRMVWALIVTLGSSRHAFVFVSFQMKARDLINGLEAAWSFFGGIVERVLLDNQKIAVKKADRYQPELSREFQEYAQVRGFLADPTRVASPQDNSKVERSVSYVRNSFFRGETFFDLETMQEAATRWCLEKAGTRIHGTTRQAPLEVFEREEKALLKPFSGERYDVPEWTEAKVHPDHHIQFRRSLYSVPTQYIGKKVVVRGDSAIVRIYSFGEVVKVHPRQQPGKRSTDFADYPKEKTAYAMRSSSYCITAAGKYGENVEAFCSTLLSGTFPWSKLRQAQKLTRLGERYGAARLDAAAKRAISFDLIDVYRLERILVAALDGKRTKAAEEVIALPSRFARSADSFSDKEKSNDGCIEGTAGAAEELKVVGDARNIA